MLSCIRYISLALLLTGMTKKAWQLTAEAVVSACNTGPDMEAVHTDWPLPHAEAAQSAEEYSEGQRG